MRQELQGKWVVCRDGHGYAVKFTTDVWVEFCGGSARAEIYKKVYRGKGAKTRAHKFRDELDPNKSNTESLEMEFTDGAWYLVKYEGIGKTYRAPAIYRKESDSFDSVEFSGVPFSEVDVLSEVVF